MRSRATVVVLGLVVGALLTGPGCGKTKKAKSGGPDPVNAGSGDTDGMGAPDGTGADPAHTGPPPTKAPGFVRPGSEVKQPTYDPSKPDLNYDFAKFQVFPLNKDPAADAEAKALAGKVVLAEGIISGLGTSFYTSEESIVLRSPNGKGGGVVCEILNPVDWRKVQPGMSARVVGVFNRRETKGLPASVQLVHSEVLAVSGKTCPVVEATTLAEEYQKAPKDFDKKWKGDSYYLVRGELLSKAIVGRHPAGQTLWQIYFSSPKLEVRCYCPMEKDDALQKAWTRKVVTVLATCEGAGPGLSKGTLGVNLRGKYLGTD
jgi:hypothetical protein